MMQTREDKLSITTTTHVRPADEAKYLKKVLKDSPNYFIHSLPDSLIKWMIAQAAADAALLEFLQGDVFCALQAKSYTAPYRKPDTKELLNSLLHDLNKLKQICGGALKSTLTQDTSQGNTQNIQFSTSYLIFAKNILCRVAQQCPALREEVRAIQGFITKAPASKTTSDKYSEFILLLHSKMDALASKLELQLKINPKLYALVDELSSSLILLAPLAQGSLKILQEALLQSETFFHRIYLIALNLLQGFILTLSEHPSHRDEKKLIGTDGMHDSIAYLKVTLDLFALSEQYLNFLITSGVRNFFNGFPHISFDHGGIILNCDQHKESDIKRSDTSSKKPETQIALAYLQIWLNFTKELLKDKSLFTSIQLLKDLHQVQLLPDKSARNEKFAALTEKATGRDVLILPRIVLAQLLAQERGLSQTDSVDFLESSKDYLDRNKKILLDFVGGNILTNLAKAWQQAENQNSVYILADRSKPFMQFITTCQFLVYSYLDYIGEMRGQTHNEAEQLKVCRSVLVDDIYPILRAQEKLLSFSKQVFGMLALNEFFFFIDKMLIAHYSIVQRFHQQKHELYRDLSNDNLGPMVCNIPFKFIDIDFIYKHNRDLLIDLYKIFVTTSPDKDPLELAPPLIKAVSLLLERNTTIAQQFFAEKYQEEFYPAQGILTIPNQDSDNIVDDEKYKSVLDQLKQDISSVYHGAVAEEINAHEQKEKKADRVFASLTKQEEKKRVTEKKEILSTPVESECTDSEDAIPAEQNQGDDKQAKASSPLLTNLDQRFYNLYIEAKKTLNQPTLYEKPHEHLKKIIDELYGLTQAEDVKTKAYAWMVLGDIFTDRGHHAFLKVLNKNVGLGARMAQYESATKFNKKALTAYKQFIQAALLLPATDCEQAKILYSASLDKNSAQLNRYKNQLSKIKQRLDFLEQRKIQVISIKGAPWYYSPHFIKDQQGNLVKKPLDTLSVEARELRAFEATYNVMKENQHTQEKYLQLLIKQAEKRAEGTIPAPKEPTAQQLSKLGFHKEKNNTNRLPIKVEKRLSSLTFAVISSS